MKPDDIKREQDELLEKVENLDREVEVVMDKDRELNVPLKVGLRKNVQLSDLPVMWLFALGNLTIEEYNKYLTENAGKLTINEITASDLLTGVMKKDEESLKTYWRLNERMMANKGMVTNNIKIDIKPNAVMTELLASIEDDIFGVDNAIDAEYTDSNTSDEDAHRDLQTDEKR